MAHFHFPCHSKFSTFCATFGRLKSYYARCDIDKENKAHTHKKAMAFKSTDDFRKSFSTRTEKTLFLFLPFFFSSISWAYHEWHSENCLMYLKEREKKRMRERNEMFYTSFSLPVSFNTKMVLLVAMAKIKRLFGC